MGLLKQTRPRAETNDLALAQRMLAGDESAFETFFETSFPALFRFSLSRVRDPEIAREMAQTTLCKAIANLPKYRGDAPLTAWVFTICRNEVRAHFRRLGKNPAPEELLEEAPEVRLALGRIAAGVDSPEQALHRKEVSQQIHDILDQLPPRYGQVLEWKYIDDLTVKEIAAHLELGPKAAESLLTRARVAFKEAYLALGQSKHPNPALRSTHWSAALLSFAWPA